MHLPFCTIYIFTQNVINRLSNLFHIYLSFFIFTFDNKQKRESKFVVGVISQLTHCVVLSVAEHFSKISEMDLSRAKKISRAHSRAVVATPRRATTYFPRRFGDVTFFYESSDVSYMRAIKTSTVIARTRALRKFRSASSSLRCRYRMQNGRISTRRDRRA